MTVNEVFQWLDQIAPFATQAENDNSGLLLGDPNALVHRILFTLDVTSDAVTQAAKEGAELIVSHHPLMFDPIQQIRYDQGEGAVIRSLAAAGISLIAAHTNLDICEGGVADSLARALGLLQITPCEQCPYLRTGTLSTPLTAAEFLSVVNRSLSASARLFAGPDTIIRRVAVTPGAGGSDSQYADADAYVTGEVKHHELLAAHARGLSVIDAGHYPTEFPGVAALYKRFLAAASRHGWAVEATLYTQPPYPCITHV